MAILSHWFALNARSAHFSGIVFLVLLIIGIIIDVLSTRGGITLGILLIFLIIWTVLGIIACQKYSRFRDSRAYASRADEEYEPFVLPPCGWFAKTQSEKEAYVSGNFFWFF